MPRVPNARWREAGGKQRIQVSYYAGGRRYQPWAPEGLTLTQAQKWAQRQRYELEHGIATPEAPAPSTRTVADVCTAWLAWYKPTCRSKNTLRRYANDVQRLVTLLGTRPLADMTSTEIETARNALLTGGKAPSTVRQTLHLFQAICAWAMDEDRGWLARNPVTKVLKATRGVVQQLDYAPLTTAETRRLAGVFEAHAVVGDVACPYACMLGLALGTALRVESEWGGAQWQDVDLERGTFTLSRSWDSNHHELTHRRSGKLKQRLVALHASTVGLLRAQRAWQTAITGEEPESGAFVFANWTGEPLARSSLALWLDRFAWEAGIVREAGQHLTPHSLRHQAAIEALRAGANPKAVQAMLGHSTIGMTMDRYAAYVPGLEETATAAVGGLFGGTWSAAAV